MNAQELRLDYFQFYDVANQEANYFVGLQGQFDRQPEKARLMYLNLFANPVSKNGEPMFDKNAHFNWYHLYDPTPEPTRVVTFENQFGKQKVVIGRALALLAPAQKVEPGSEFPERLDHYKVYSALQGEPVNKAVELEDQFGRAEARVYYPRMFAVPVRKWFQGETSGINNERAHLAIYIINPRAVEQVKPVRDQFSRRYVQVFRSVLLAAPSVKLAWERA